MSLVTVRVARSEEDVVMQAFPWERAFERWGGVIARILMSAIFLISAIGKITAFSAMSGFAAAKGMPFPELAIATAIAIELLGGLAIFTGRYQRAGAFVLFLFLIPTTLIFHNFWAAPAAARQDQMIHLFKNLAIMGGLLFVATTPTRNEMAR